MAQQEPNSDDFGLRSAVIPKKSRTKDGYKYLFRSKRRQRHFTDGIHTISIGEAQADETSAH